MAMHESKADKAERLKFEAEGDLRTLTRAGEIKSDKGRMNRAMAMAKEQLAELKEVQSG